jgi:hypothetical protein
LLLWAEQRRFGILCAAAGVGWVWLMATPWAAERLVGSLERLHPAMSVADSPSGDLLVVLGGAVVGAPEFDTSEAFSGRGDRPGAYKSITCRRSEGYFQIFL